MDVSDVGVMLFEGQSDLVPEDANLPTNYVIYRTDDPTDVMALEQRHDIEIVIFDRETSTVEPETLLDCIGSLRYECQVAMVTAVKPGYRIIKDGVDAFITKPATVADVKETIQDLVEREVYARRRQEFCSLLSARKALEKEMSASELAANEEYLDICDRITYLSTDLGKANNRLADETEFVSHLRDIEKNVSKPV